MNELVTFKSLFAGQGFKLMSTLITDLAIKADNICICIKLNSSEAIAYNNKNEYIGKLMHCDIEIDKVYFTPITVIY